MIKIKKKHYLNKKKIYQENNDSNHYTTVSEKYEKVVAELPVDVVYTEEQFDEKGQKIKALITPELNFTEYEVDSLVFHGKRFLKNNNINEAKKCMEELNEMEASADILGNPEKLVKMALGSAATITINAEKYVQTHFGSPLANEIENELRICLPIVNGLFEKYSDMNFRFSKEEMKTDATTLISATAKLYHLTQNEIPQDNTTQNLFTGLVSKS